MQDHAGRPLAGPAPAGALAAVPEERRALAVLGEVRRLGKWVVPRVFRVRAFLGEVKLDLRDNPIPQDFTLDVGAVGSRVTLIVPPEASTTFDVFVVLGNAINQAPEPVQESSDRPRVHVRGSAFLGEVRVLVRERGA